MISYLFWRGVSLFQISDPGWLAPWPGLSWRVLIPTALVGNVVVAIFAWFIVALLMKLT